MKRFVKRLLAATGLRPTSWDLWRQTDALEAVQVPDPRDARGRLRIWVSDESESDEEPARFRTTWVPGDGYDGMRNNDLRGYLDGRFQFAWNQVSQAHVRVGRFGHWVEYGEHELFRVLHRWDGVRLPAGAQVVGADLTLGVEAGPSIPLRLHLYGVRRDWNPGDGGRDHDNVSPPAEGEAWWNEAEHGRAPWGLPGVGFADDMDPDADATAQPLAEADYTPGNSELCFSSPEFAKYCGRAVRNEEPIRLLLKLSDAQEDVPGTALTLYGADQGDDRTLVRRPRLGLDWTSQGRLLSSTTLRLEHGRSLALPRFETPRPGWRWAEFTPYDGSGPLRVEALSSESGLDEWDQVRRPFFSSDPALHLRARCLINPVRWGEAFTVRFRDTWIRSGPPAEQDVPFSFTSPAGVDHSVSASFQGDATWVAAFVPDEVGPWRYRWSHRLSDEPYASAEGEFDVIVTDRKQGMAALRSIAAQARRLGVRSRPIGGRRLLVAFSRVERAIMALETPDSWRSESFAPIGELLDSTREALWGNPVPRELPMVPCVAPSWMTSDRDVSQPVSPHPNTPSAEDS